MHHVEIFLSRCCKKCHNVSYVQFVFVSIYTSIIALEIVSYYFVLIPLQPLCLNSTLQLAPERLSGSFRLAFSSAYLHRVSSPSSLVLQRLEQAVHPQVTI